jgi:dienelactone hydrolase
MRRLACLLALACAAGAPAAQAQTAAEPVDCTGPAPAAEPGTSAWDQREAENAWCATQRNLDTHTNPLYLTSQANRPPNRATTAMDPMREPAKLAGKRFRFDELSFTDAGGKAYPAFLFRPCDASCVALPAGLARYDPPYPAVVIMHGGAANHEMYLWAAEGLAEAGYMVLTVNIGRTDTSHYATTRTALDWLLSTPSQPFADGSHNPRWAELDRARVGLAGHSAGGVAVSRLGQEDPRVSAIVSWDRAQSGRMPDDLAIDTPALFLVADFNCQQVPVCLPERRATAPDPLGPGNKDEDFRRLRAAGVDTMKVALRAATHLDFTEWPELNASRYGAVTSFYYTLAWFDRYLKGVGAGREAIAAEATARLTATRFDDSADVHNISTGRFDPATLGNLSARIDGQPVADRLSFHFRSGYWLDGGALACESVRTGC